MESIVTNKEEFARWMEEWLHRIPKGGVLDFPPGKPTSVVSQGRGSQCEPTASTDEHERFQAGCKKPQQTNADSNAWPVLTLDGLLGTALHEGMHEGVHREKPVRILVVDDVAPWRACIRSLLLTRPEWQVIGEARDGLQAVQMTGELCPDIVLLDIGMPVLNGIEAAKRIRQQSPASRIIFATQNNDAEIRKEALAIGAEGYLLKANAARELLPAIEAALKNGH